MTNSERIDLLNEIPQRVEALLAAFFQQNNVPKYRVGQALSWIYERDAAGFAAMTDLPTKIREKLAETFDFANPETARVEVSQDGTAKHLWRLHDGELIESVLIPVRGRLTLCISSQAGCAMACTFCATGWSGYRRNLTPAEIVAQFRGARRWARENDRGPITNIVYMGMGEPLHHYAETARSIRLITHPLGAAMSPRRITVSTVGLISGIRKLGEDFGGKVGLAISLHAPDTETRSRIVPMNEHQPMSELILALKKYPLPKRRRITIEYTLIGGVNDEVRHARALAQTLRGLPAKVNLIPMNPIEASALRAPQPEAVEAFRLELAKLRVSCSVRQTRGDDVNAACGQLALASNGAPVPAAQGA
jgi:23S rRNA (adenine2503-C2)-methyltransferase